MLTMRTENRTKSKLLINIGSGFDIPTANLLTGSRGETIINGGLAQVSAIAGAGNNYKSTITHHMMLSAANRLSATTETGMTTYDTEVNIVTDRLEDFASNFMYLPLNPITDTGMWAVTDKSLIPANVWITDLNKYLEAKRKNKSLIRTFTAFIDPYTKEPLEMLVPTFVEIDSFSEFEAESTTEMLMKDLDDSATNTYAMRQGLFKTKFLSQLPRLSVPSNTFFLLTAHIGTKIDMATGPAKYQQPSKSLQYLKAGDTIKGIPPKSNYLFNNFWFAHTATQLKNQTTKLAEYPYNSTDSLETDLNVVKFTLLRGKHGPSGYTIEIVVSQTKGVLPTLTEFHHVKTNGKFGIQGNDRSYQMVLRPDVNLSRTTVRFKIDNDPLLQRAINITSELAQLHKFHTHLAANDLLCTPAELYNDLIELGYDWDVLLTTRGWWAVDNYASNIPDFLSVVDLLKMRRGIYIPYWLDKDTAKKVNDNLKVRKGNE